VTTDYLEDPIEHRWASPGMCLRELACNLTSIGRMTASQPNFKLPSGFSIPKPLFRYLVVQPPNRETCLRSVEASPKHIVKCVQTM